MPNQHEKPYQQEHRANEELAPFSYSFLYAEHARALLQNRDQHNAENGICDDAPDGIKHSIKENASTVFYIPADISDRCYIGGQRAWRDGGEQTEKKSFPAAR